MKNVKQQTGNKKVKKEDDYDTQANENNFSFFIFNF